MSSAYVCDICHTGYNGKTERGDGVNVRRYVIRRYVPLKEGQRGPNRNNPTQGNYESAGSLDICDKCWRLICEPRMKRRRNRGHDA